VAPPLCALTTPRFYHTGHAPDMWFLLCASFSPLYVNVRIPNHRTNEEYPETPRNY